MKYDKVNDADTRGQYFEPDADFELTVSRVMEHEGTNGDFFIVETIVDKCEKYPDAIGEQRVWLQKVGPKIPWERELRAFACAVCKLDPSDKSLPVGKLLEAAVKDEKFNGLKVKLTTQGTLSKEKKTPFTRHIWKQASA
jgi:hypothetical protein